MSIDKALNLITSQHRDKPKFVSWVSVPLSMIDNMDTAEILEAFDLDKAIGVQLDELGKIIGVGRILGFQPASGESPVMDDTTYRLALKARIIQNQWDGTVEQLHRNWNAVFPLVDLIVKDKQDMSMEMLVLGMAVSIEQDLIREGYIIPKPQGVSVSYEFGDIVDSEVFLGIAVQEGVFETVYQLV